MDTDTEQPPTVTVTVEKHWAAPETVEVPAESLTAPASKPRPRQRKGPHNG